MEHTQLKSKENKPEARTCKKWSGCSAVWTSADCLCVPTLLFCFFLLREIRREAQLGETTELLLKSLDFIL